MLLSTLVIGLVLGGTYALIALGLTIQYGIARIMNLAYGEIAVAGAFFTILVVTGAGLSPILGLAAVIPLCFLLSWAIYRVALQPLVRRARHPGQLEIDSILVTFGLMFLAQGLFTSGFGAGFQGYNWRETPVELFGANIAQGRVLGLVFAVVLGGALWLGMTRSRWGRSLRAVANRPEFAPLVGINRDRVASMAFSIGGAIAGAGGAILTMYQPLTAADGAQLTMKALVIVIMGGVGNLAGALVAGLIVGLVEAYVSYALDPGLTLAATYILFLAVLILRPKGLFA